MQYLSTLMKLPQQSFYMAAGTLLNRMGSAAVLFLILYLHNNKGISISFAGVIFSCYGLGAFFAGPLSGWLSDKYGAHKVCIFSLFVSGILMLFYPFVANLGLIFMTFLWGLIGEAYRPASQVIISHLCLPEQRKTAYALNRLALNLGMSIAPLLGSLLFIWHYNAIFYVDGATAILAAIFLSRVLWTHFKKNPILKDSRQLFMTSLSVVLKDKRMLSLVLAMVFALMAFFQQASTLSLFMVDDLHLTTTLFGLIFLLNTLMIIVIELPLNIKMTNTPFHIALTFSALFISCGFGIYYFAHGPLIIATGVVLWSLGEMILFPTIAAYIFEIAPENYRGAYMGFFSMGVNIAFIAGPLIGTFLYHNHGKDVWLVCFIAGILSAVLFYRLGKYEKAI